MVKKYNYTEKPGRPTKYDPEFCDRIIEMGRLGKSINQMACGIGITKQTLLEWVKEKEEFSYAFSLAKQYSQDWWENIAQSHMLEKRGGPRLNPGLWSRSMAARFPEEYRENKSVELSGKGGSPMINEITIIGIDPEDDDSRDT